MPRKTTISQSPVKISRKNKAGDIAITSNGKYKVWTGRGWSGDYESQTGAINQMHILHGDIGPRLVQAPTSTKRKRGGTVSPKGIGLTKKDTDAAKRKRKRTPAMGVTSKDVQQAKKKRKPSVSQRRRAAHQMADVEKDVTKDVKRGKKYSDIAKTISETGGLRGKIARGALALQGHIGDTTYKEAIKRGKAQGAKAREKARTATDRTGKEHMDPYGLIRKSITGEKRKGGSVKRKSGGKV